MVSPNVMAWLPSNFFKVIMQGIKLLSKKGESSYCAIKIEKTLFSICNSQRKLVVLSRKVHEKGIDTVLRSLLQLETATSICVVGIKTI